MGDRHPVIEHPPAISQLARQHYSWVVYWGLMAALGVAVSFSGELLFAAVMFVAMYLGYFFRAVPYSKVWLAAVKQSLPPGASKRIRLRICDEGLHETIEEQVESFVPWPAVLGFYLIEDHLLIQLAGDLWANVPRLAVTQGDAAFDEFVALLRSRGVSELPTEMRGPAAQR